MLQRAAGKARPSTRLEQDERRRCHELLDGDRCHLLVMAFEVAGRWGHEAVTFLQTLPWYKSLSVPRPLRRCTQLLFFQSWKATLACTKQRVCVVSLLELPLGACSCGNGPAVCVGDLDWAQRAGCGRPSVCSEGGPVLGTVSD